MNEQSLLVNCNQAVDIGKPHSVRCAIGKYFEPSVGTCMKVCNMRVKIEEDDGKYSPPIQVVISHRPAPDIHKVMSCADAALQGTYVDRATVLERMEICKRCEYRATDKKGDWCSLCGCGLSYEDKRLTNLAAYEENLPVWGCKHPNRHHGKGWPQRSIRREVTNSLTALENSNGRTSTAEKAAKEKDASGEGQA